MTLKESTFQERVERGLRINSKKLIEQKQRLGQTLVVSRDNKIVHIKASDIELDG